MDVDSKPGSFFKQNERLYRLNLNALGSILYENAIQTVSPYLQKDVNLIEADDAASKRSLAFPV